MLWIVDGLPFTKVMFSLACHAVYSTNLASFPYINLISVPFLSSVGKHKRTRLRPHTWQDELLLTREKRV